MGNYISSWKDWYYGVYPKPWSLDTIQPELRVYRRGVKSVVKYGVNTTSIVSRLQNEHLLDVKRLVFIVHGFKNTGDETWLNDMKEVFLNVEDLTVVIVSWALGSNLNVIEYHQAASNTRLVADYIADIASSIKQADKRTQTVRLHGIGHSLGAHIVGMAGRKSKVFERISGLDPAGPDFTTDSLAYTSGGLRGLCNTDAISVVDVIHTSAYKNLPEELEKVGLPDHFGKFDPMGTVDFYPNYGYNQPGAVTGLGEEIVDAALGPDVFGESHARAYVLFTWSILNRGKLMADLEFVEAPTETDLKPAGKPVTAPVEMGFYTDAGNATPTGLYYLKTKAAQPWK